MNCKKEEIILCLMLSSCLGRTIVDLSHTLDENSPKYPLSEELFPNFTYYKGGIMKEDFVDWGTPGMLVSIGRVEFYEHYGTHMDAPAHFGYGQDRMAEIPPERLICPGVVIEVKDKARDDPNYAVSVQDIYEFERKHGRIPPNAIVIMNSGWSEFFHDHQKYLGSTTLKDVTSLNFPGFGLDACRFLFSERNAAVLGVDTMSLDPGHSWKTDVYGKPYPCHHYLQPKNVPLLENDANLDSIPPVGITMFLGGLKTKTGTGSPARILAVIEDKNGNKGAMTDVYCVLIITITQLCI